MKRLMWLGAALLVGCGFNPGITGSGTLVTRDIAVSDFSSIDAGGAMKINVTQGDAPHVSVTADDNLWQYLDVHADGGVLHVSLKGGSFRNTHVSADITVAHLNRLSVAGATNAIVHGVRATDGHLDLQLSGASTLDGDVNARDMGIDISGASTAKLSGQTDRLDVTVSGASHALLRQLQSQTTHANVNGASSADIHASGNLDYDVSGASHLSYAGGAAVKQGHTSGASSAGAIN